MSGYVNPDGISGPSSWEVLRARFLFRERREAAGAGSTPLAATQDFGVIPQDVYEERTGNRVTTAGDTAGLKRVCPGDFVISLRTFQGGVELARNGGCISPAYTVLEPAQSVVPNFFRFLLKSHPFLSVLQTVVTGIRDGKAVRYKDFSQILLPVPEVSTQSKVGDFLDRETAHIDRLIEKKERLIALLEEKRSALITRVVTKGLDPDVPTKDSGVEWLDQVPVQWDQPPIRGLALPGRSSFVDGDWIESPFITDSGVRLIQTGNIGVGEYREQGFRYISEESFSELGCTEVLPGDLLICRLASPVGRACVAPDLGVRMITSVDVAILRPNSSVWSRFLVYLFSCRPYLDWMSAEERGGTRGRVSRSMLGRVRIPLPPIEEQEAISEFLDAETARLRELARRVQGSVDLLRERRSVLITAAVTGQIDVNAYERWHRAPLAPNEEELSLPVSRTGAAD